MQDVGSKEDTELSREDLTVRLARVACRITWTLSVCWKLASRGQRAVSRFQEAGLHGDLITKWLGHTSLKMTSKYTHFSAKHRKEVVAKLGAITS
jgi:integrase